MNVNSSQRVLFNNRVSLDPLKHNWLGRSVLLLCHSSVAPIASALLGFGAATAVVEWFPASTEEGQFYQSGARVVTALACSLLDVPLRRLALKSVHAWVYTSQWMGIAQATHAATNLATREKQLKKLEGLFVLSDGAIRAYSQASPFTAAVSELPKKRVFLDILNGQSPTLFQRVFHISQFLESPSTVISREAFMYGCLFEETIRFLNRPANAAYQEKYMQWPFGDWCLKGRCLSEKRCQAILERLIPQFLSKYYPSLSQLLKEGMERAIHGKPGEDLFLAMLFLTVVRGVELSSDLQEFDFEVLEAYEEDFLAFLYYFALTNEVELLFRGNIRGLSERLRDSFGERDCSPSQIVNSLRGNDPLETFFKHTNETTFAAYIALQNLKKEI